MSIPKRKPKKLKEPIAKKGLVLVTVGAGKGKTTAAIGQAIRSAGSGMDVYFIQFIKARPVSPGKKRESGEWPVSSEIHYFNGVNTNRGIGNIKSKQVGRGFVGILGDKKEKAVHIKSALDGLEFARKTIQSKKYGLVVLDEILTAIDLKLLTQQDIIDLITNKPEYVHIFMTGHEKYPKIFKHCDTITEMNVVKHAYYQGVLAQKGLDF